MSAFKASESRYTAHVSSFLFKNAISFVERVMSVIKPTADYLSRSQSPLSVCFDFNHCKFSQYFSFENFAKFPSIFFAFENFIDEVVKM